MLIRYIQLGRLKRPHGFRGSVVVECPAGKDCALGYLREVWIGVSKENLSPYPLLEASWMPSGWKISLLGVDTQELKSLLGKALFARREDLSEPESDEYYIDDLLGFQGWDSKTGALGSLTHVVSGNRQSADRWVFKGNQQFEVPANSRYIKGVDLEKKIILLDSFELLEGDGGNTK